jgi:hypothetical protein
MIVDVNNYKANFALLEREVAKGISEDIESAYSNLDTFIKNWITACREIEPTLAEFAGIPRAVRDSDGKPIAMPARLRRSDHYSPPSKSGPAST